MKRRASLRTQIVGNSIRAAIRYSEWARHAARTFLSQQVQTAVLILLACLFLPPSAQGQSAFTTIDVTGAGTGEFQGTAALGIDTAGDTAGTYVDANNITHGFVRAASGTITTYTAPLAGVAGAGSTTGGKGTYFTSMDGAGDIAGYYSDANNLYHALFLTAGSTTMTYFDAPGATTFGHLGTAATGINASGVVTGFYRDTNLVYHGFVRAANGTFTQIDAPGAGTATVQGTQPLSINSAGVITGDYMDTNFVRHGFVRAADGTITTFDPTGVATGPFTFNTESGTIPFSINTAGLIAGAYGDANNVDHLFVRAANGTITSIDAPGEGGTTCTSVPHYLICGTGGLSMNAAGDITGGYADDNGIMHGFLRAVDTGNITSFDAPGAGDTSTFQGTSGTGINTAGTIVGTYVDNNVVMHGFIYTPTLTATATVLTPVPTPNPSVYGEPVTLTAAVSYSGGAPPNGENVTFMSGTTSLGTTQLTSGVASLTTTALPTGTDSITAVYGGDSDFSGSTSAAASQTVNKASSSTTLTSSLNPSVFGQSVTLKASVSGQFSGVATGTVTFSNGSSSLGSPSVSNNVATLTTAALPAGTDSITAVYNGDSNFTGSTSNTVSQVVNAAPPAPTISSLSPAFTSSGGAAFTLTVNGTGFVSGSSTVYWGSTALTTTYVSAMQPYLTAQVPVSDIASSGTANITVQTPSPGGGTSNALVFEIDSGSSGSGPTFTTITATVAPGATATYPVTLPSGASDVTVTCLNLPTGASCSYSASSGEVTITTSATTPAGTYQITVVFAETLPGAATGLIILPILLLPLAWVRRRWMRQHIWITACLGLVILTGAVGIGCGGSSTQQTHTVTGSGAVTLIVQ